MANAWCINAYDCNGCLIQTLQNLDSACIGVGVQYTAPNPLDDKRIDYIKYTDKCGCTCCLSAENEILIYATNGVIKNLTLTNDDVNEAIKIKWNDIFWSNRAKTIVRYKTGSAPVSITDGTLAVEETTKNQYSSTPFSLTGVLDETTYYISAFAVDWDGTIINVQSWSVTTSFEFNRSILDSTVCYFPFLENNTDKTWQTSLSSWWTKQTLWYRFSWSSEITLWWNKTSIFTSFRIKPNSINAYEWNALVWPTDKWINWYNIAHTWNFVNRAQFKTWWSWYRSPTDLWTVWQRMHLWLWFNWTEAYVYKNWVKEVIVSATSYEEVVYKKFIIWNGWSYNFDIAYFIADWVDRESEIVNAFNRTKSKFWL